MNNSKKTNPLQQGVVIMVILAVLTIVEFILASSNLTLALILIAIVKAGIVLQYYMHLPRLFSKEGEH
jgi:heme/copper-type cytochrome/quinol oxidase subunit 4